MQLHCTRPGCSRPVNHHPNLKATLQTTPQLFCTNCGMPLILSGRYLPERLLGQGGFGAAYYARDRYTPTRRPCVVKLFQPSTQLTQQQLQIAQQLFAREAEVLERLGNQHPQIPDLYAYFPVIVKSPTSGQDEEYFYLVQEFIDGEDLEQILKRRGPLPENAVKAILISILKVLTFVHDNGAIHRDIKPSNIMKTVDNKLFLLDFGAVKQVTGAVASTRSTGIYTTGYAPQEQMTGGQVFPSSDLYSLAVTCIVLLTGKETTELFDSYSNCWQWRNHTTLRDSQLANILDKLLSTSPQDRYTSAQETLKALLGTPATPSAYPAGTTALQPSTPATAAPPAIPVAQPPQVPSTPSTNQPVRSASKVSKLWIAGLALLALLAAGGMWFRQQTSVKVGEEIQLLTGSAAAKFTDVEVPSGQFTYGGSTTWAPIRGEIDRQLQQAVPGLTLLYRDPANQPPGSSAGIQMLLNGELDFAQSSRPLTAEEKRQAEQQGLKLQDIPIAVEGLAIVIHPQLPLSNMSQTQLKDIYTGQVVNWQELGGPNLPIIPISRNEGGGSVQFFKKAVLDGQALADTVQRSNSTTEAIRVTASTPGAIYYASAPDIVDQCTVKPISIDQQPPYRPPYIELQNCPNQRNQPNLEGFTSGDYPLTRQIYVITKQDAPIGQAYAELMLSEEGQTSLNTLGFAQLR